MLGINIHPVMFCGWNGERLTRVSAGNIIDYAHANGYVCSHGYNTSTKV